MIKIKKDEVKIKVSEDEKNKEALLMAELSVALIEVANYLRKDREEVLRNLNTVILFTIDIDNIIDNLEECMEGKDG